MSFKLKLSFLVIAGACFCCGAQAENLNSEKAVPHKAEPAGSTGKQVQTAGPAANGTAAADPKQTKPQSSAKQPAAAKRNAKRTPFSKFKKECYAGVPEVDQSEFDSRTTPVNILSDEANTADKNNISFRGNVKITQGNRTMDADYTQFNRTNQKFNAYGNINYRDGYISIRDASEVESSIRNKTLSVTDPKYQLHGSPARGEASKADYNQLEKSYHLEKATFTTCQENAETWHLEATTVNIDEDEVFGEAWNASLWLYRIPIFYLPYINFPIRNERKTGFLYPEIGYSGNDGFKMTAPFYWNIAPNYDYTLTPTWMGHRGLHLSNEFRYMISPRHTGDIIYEYTAHDKLAEKEDGIDSSRWYKHWSHRSSFLNGKLSLFANYNKVREKDYNYFNDYTKQSGSTDKVVQSLGMVYSPFNFTTVSVKAENYQMLIDTSLKPFEVLPQITVKNFTPLPGMSLYNTFEFANFSHSSENKQDGNFEGKRYHMQSKLQLPLIQQPFFQLDSNLRMMFTHYDQTVLGDQLLSYYTRRGFTNIASSVNRFIPTFQIQARLIMDNDFSLFGHNFSQSLEPIIQYYYAPYRNQDDIGLYDTTNIVQDYFFIFDDNKYAGIDRITDDNRLSTGFVSRISDENGIERAIFSLGLAYYLREGKVKLYPKYNEPNRRRSFLNASLDLKPFNNVLYNGSLVYNTEDRYLDRASSVLEYNSDNWVAQLNYRYTRNGNMTMFGNEIIDMRQLGLLTKFSFSDRLSMVLGYYQDLEQKRAIDRVIKLRYEDCCWRFSAYAEQVYEPDNRRKIADLDTKFGIQFEMKGLATLGAKDISDTMDTRLLPYSRPFNLSEK